jgi:type IV fimbrial biogenesis protein FimT
MRCLGFTLTELLISLSLLSLLIGLATPSWRSAQDKVQLNTSHQQLVIDVQTARTQALQRGANLKMTRITGCAWATSTSTDWSCGWQVQTADTGDILWSHHTALPLRISFSNAGALTINGQGNFSSLGIRWVFQTLSGQTLVVCINTTGRIRSIAAEACS